MPQPPLVYDPAALRPLVGAVHGYPAGWSYRIEYCQAVPARTRWRPDDVLPRVTTARTVVLACGEGAGGDGAGGVSTAVALATAALLCLNIAYGDDRATRRFWYFLRIAPEEIRSIDWRALTPPEHAALADAVRAEPLRSAVGGRVVGGRSSGGRPGDITRRPLVYRYPDAGMK